MDLNKLKEKFYLFLKYAHLLFFYLDILTDILSLKEYYENDDLISFYSIIISIIVARLMSFRLVVFVLGVENKNINRFSLFFQSFLITITFGDPILIHLK
jgi:hypothetical protein